MDKRVSSDVVIDVENLVWRHIREYRAETFSWYRRHQIIRRLLEIRGGIVSPAALRAVDRLIEEDTGRRLQELAEREVMGIRRSDESLTRIAATSAGLHYQDMEIKTVRPVRIFFCIKGRNAWHSTWVRRYTEKSMHSTVKSAFGWAEEQRGPGNVFYVMGLPALRINLADVSILVTEINSPAPMNWGLRSPHWVEALTSGRRFRGFIELCYDRLAKEASEYENLVLFRTERNLYLDPISNGHEMLPSWKSSAVGAKRYLNWGPQTQTTDGSTIIRIAQATQMRSEGGTTA